MINEETVAHKKRYSTKEKLDTLMSSLGVCLYQKRFDSDDGEFPIGEFYQAYLGGDDVLWMSMCRNLLTGTNYKDTQTRKAAQSMNENVFDRILKSRRDDDGDEYRIADHEKDVIDCTDEDDED